MKAAGNDVQGMFSNDIVGASQAFDGTRPDPFSVRLFVEGVPTDVTAAEISTLQATGGENDGYDHKLGPVRHVGGPGQPDRHEHPGHLATRPLPAGQRPPVLPGRGLAGGPDHRAAGELQPRAPRGVGVVNGVKNGNLPEFVDFSYVARVARVNGAALWALATDPRPPKNLQIHTAPPAGFAGTDLTTLTWDANPDPDLAGYEVVMSQERPAPTGPARSRSAP